MDLISTGSLLNSLDKCNDNCSPPKLTWMISLNEVDAKLAFGMSLGPVNSAAVAHVPVQSVCACMVVASVSSMKVNSFLIFLG